MILLRDSAMMGREPFTPEDLGILDEAIRCQRVWLGAIAPNDHVFKDQFHMWSHTYFFHIMWYVEKYGGVGSLTQQGIELAHKEVHKDVAIFSVAGTRIAKPADWIRIMAGYNIDLYRLSKEVKGLLGMATFHTRTGACACMMLSHASCVGKRCLCGFSSSRLAHKCVCQAVQYSQCMLV